MSKAKKTSNDLEHFLVGFIENFIKKIGDGIMNDVKNKAKEILEDLKRKTSGTFFILSGFVFILIGSAVFLERLSENNGLGYLIIGSLVFLLGFVLINIKK